MFFVRPDLYPIYYYPATVGIQESEQHHRYGAFATA